MLSRASILHRHIATRVNPFHSSRKHHPDILALLLKHSMEMRLLAACAGEIASEIGRISAADLADRIARAVVCRPRAKLLQATGAGQGADLSVRVWGCGNEGSKGHDGNGNKVLVTVFG